MTLLESKENRVTRERVAAIYRLPPEHVLVFEHAAAYAIKITIPRPVTQPISAATCWITTIKGKLNRKVHES